MPRIAKTVFKMEVNENEYNVLYNGTLSCPETREQRKHNERLMRALLASDELLTFLYNIVDPVVRYKRREAKRQARKQNPKT